MLKRLKLAVLLFTVLFTLNAQAAENTKKHDIYCPVLTYHRLTNDISKTTDWTVTPEKLRKIYKTFWKTVIRQYLLRIW